MTTTATTTRAATTTSTTKTKPKPVRIADAFTSPTLDAARWSSWDWGAGGTSDQGNGELVFALPANPQFDPQFNITGTNYTLTCRFVGDFDARVDYKLLDWPTGNDASVEFTAATPEWTWIISRSGGSYSSWPTGVSVPSNDTFGTLRFARSNGVLKMFFWRAGRWREVGETELRGEARLQLGLKAAASNWQQTSVSAAFANFVATAPDADCPPGDDPRG